MHSLEVSLAVGYHVARLAKTLSVPRELAAFGTGGYWVSSGRFGGVNTFAVSAKQASCALQTLLAIRNHVTRLAEALGEPTDGVGGGRSSQGDGSNSSDHCKCVCEVDCLLKLEK